MFDDYESDTAINNFKFVVLAIIAIVSVGFVLYYIGQGLTVLFPN